MNPYNRQTLAALAVTVTLVASAAHADPLNCNMSGYKGSAGLLAAVADDTLAVTWNGDNGAEVRMRLAIDRGTPTIRELAVRRRGGQWSTLATGVTPEFRVVSGVRRVTAQQLRPDSIEGLGGKLTPEILAAWDDQEKRGTEWVDIAARTGQITPASVESIKWEAFWDAPLYLEGSSERPPSHGTSIPPHEGIFGQPG